MATVTVSWDNAASGRLDDATATTNWTATGSGASPTVETDYYYQGTACISIQVKTTLYTLYYTDPTVQDMETTPMVWLAKIIQTNKNAIDGSGLQIRIGDTASVYYEYNIYTATTYPTLGGFFVQAINPNISQWRDSTSGTPDLANVAHFAGVTDASATAKAPNFGVDAIDIMETGTGLTLTRGDGSNTDGVFQDFVDADEGTSTGRWGIVQTRDGILYITGVLSIGNTSVNTEFTDSNKVLVFPDYRVSNGFCGIDFALANTGSIYSFTSCIFNARGALYTNDDTRPDYTATGIYGSLTIDSCTFNGYREASFTNACTILSTTFLNGLSIVHNSANLNSIIVSEPTNGENTAAITSDNPTELDNLTISIGSSGGHAIELTTAGDYTLTNHSYSGYSTSNGASNSTIYNNSGGIANLNIVGGDVPTIRNGTSATTNITASVNITVTGMKDNTEVRVFLADTTTVIDGTENATAGTTDDRSFTFSTSASTDLDIRLINTQYEYLLVQYTTTGAASQSIPVQQRFDRNYENP